MRMYFFSVLIDVICQSITIFFLLFFRGVVAEFLKS